MSNNNNKYGIIFMLIVNILLYSSPHYVLSLTNVEYEFLLQSQQTLDTGLLHQDILSNLQESNSSHILNPCMAYLELFAESASNFTECLILNARPFRFCEGCVVYYTKAKTVYSDLQDRKDQKCHDVLLTSDRIQILSLVYKNMNDVWKNSDCDNCFENVIEETDGFVNFTLTNDTVLFHHYFNNVTNCLNTTPGGLEDGRIYNKSDCIKCREDYSKLNGHYETIESRTSFHVCMDIIDMMNYTRLMWGKQLNCTHRVGDEAPVLGITFVMIMLPVFYYVGNRIFGAKQEKKILIQKRLKKPVQDYGSRRTTSHTGNYFTSLSSS